MAQAGAALSRGRRLALALLASALCAYGYGPEQDPFVEAWKRVAAAANQARWAEAGAAARELEPGLAELETGLGEKLRAPILASLAARDARSLARELTRAACAAVLWKLEASRRAGLDDYYAAKYRVEAARTTYLELLAPAVRARGAAGHERVLRALDAGQAALGRPGFLGRGVRPADAVAFTAAERELEAALRSVFPFAPEVSK